MPNPNIAEEGKATQFGAEAGPDPVVAQAKAATWSIRNMVRYFAANEIDPKDMAAVERFLGKKPSNAQIIALKAMQKAQSGDMRAIEYATDQIDGKLPQRSELTGADGGPIELGDADSARETLMRRLIPDASGGGASG
jgi:hypothetical protein